MDEDRGEPATANALSEKAADLLLMVMQLRRLLGAARGKIRVVDVHALVGLERPSYYRTQIIARGLRHLGWRRARYRFNGTLSYGYAKGTPLQREEILEIERGPEGEFSLKAPLPLTRGPR